MAWSQLGAEIGKIVNNIMERYSEDNIKERRLRKALNKWEKTERKLSKKWHLHHLKRPS